ncbi:MAG TPA: hypothetical protein VIL42_07240 [Sphingomicrobium sp.]|jgi:DNA ligase D-like protein (predicted ligase)
MLPTLTKQAPAGDKWLHEIKHDGYRTQLVLGDSSAAYTRNGHDWSDCYALILSDARKLNCRSAIIGGEVIVQDELGRSDFEEMKSALAHERERLIFYAFDLIHLDGEDLCRVPLIERKGRLQELVGEHDPKSRIQLTEHMIGDGPEFFEVAAGASLEGIVSKRLSSCYRSGRTRDWLKTKAMDEGEFVVIGHKRDKTRSAALLARETGDGLEYAGSAFVTLSEPERERFWRTMEHLATDTAALAATDIKGASWVRPEIKVEAQFLCAPGKLRHATLRIIL